MHTTPPRSHRSVRRNFALNILGGASLLMALQFGSVHLVVPWIGQHLQVPYILVAMILPLHHVGQVLSQLLLAPRVARVVFRKWSVTSLAIVFAVLFGLMFLAASFLRPSVAGVALLLSAGGLGLGLAVYNVSLNDLLAKTVPRRVRGRALGRQASLGGILILGISVGLWSFLPQWSGNELILLWLAVGAWLGAALAYGIVREMPSEPAPRRTPLADLKRGFALVAQHPWFARFLIWRGLALSVELAVPFYAIHAASLHNPSGQNLSTFVVAISFGLILSGPLWGRLLDRHNALVAALGPLIAGATGVAVLVITHGGAPLPLHHAILFFPLTLAREAVIQSRVRHMSVMAPPRDRPAMLAFGSASTACMAIAGALVVGFAGHMQDIRTPLVILILVNLTAAIYVRRAFAA
jgi:MFS family permease